MDLGSETELPSYKKIFYQYLTWNTGDMLPEEESPSFTSFCRCWSHAVEVMVDEFCAGGVARELVQDTELLFRSKPRDLTSWREELWAVLRFFHGENGLKIKKYT